MTIDKSALKLLKNLNGLYVDDEEDILNFAKISLGNSFNNLFTAYNGAQALEEYEQQIAQGDIQIVISDINMPKMNGIEFVKRVKQINPNTQIILVSGNADSQYLIEAINNGISSFILKPIELNVLLDRIIRLAKEYTNEQIIKNQHQELENYIGAIDKVAIISHADLKGNITYANDVFCKVSQYTKEELIGKSHNIVRHPEMPKSAFQDMWNTIQENKTWTGKVKNKAKDGIAYYTQAYIFPNYDNASKVKTGYIGIRYITTKEELEKIAFKKKVIQNVSSWKQKEKELCAQIELFKDKAQNDSSKEEIIENMNERLYQEKQRITKLLSKIDSLEDDLSHAKNDKINLIERLKSDLNETNKKFLEAKRSSTFANEKLIDIKSQLEEKIKEIERLNTIANEQKKLIEDLKDVIAHLDEKILILKGE